MIDESFGYEASLRRFLKIFVLVFVTYWFASLCVKVAYLSGMQSYQTLERRFGAEYANQYVEQIQGSLEVDH